MKLITALAVFVLLVVGFVGLTSSGSTARAAVDAKVYVANEWSKLTNDPTPLSGYTFAGSGKTIYSTFVEVNDASNVPQTTISASSERVTIFVEDADADTVEAKSQTTTANTTNPGDTIVVVLTSADSPIVDVNNDG
ncbi:MAG: hypothetical protein IIC30_02585, partial [Chloroflexi bacterium]|nr:hypothetical protein [Chloroflexota bacterium]